MEPGESIVLATEAVAERSLRTQTTVTATPVNEDGEVLSTRKAANTVTMFIQAVDPGGIPTFAEGLQASWGLLVDVVQVVILMAGAVIPFLWVPILLWLGWRFLKRRTDALESSSGLTPGSAPGELAEAGGATPEG